MDAAPIDGVIPWSTLGAWLRERVEGAEARTVEAFTARARLTFDCVLGDRSSIDDAARRLASSPAAEWETLWMGYPNDRDVALVQRWRSIVAAFDAIDEELDGEREAEQAWSELELRVREELAATDALGHELAERSTAVGASLTSLSADRSSLWPLERVGADGDEPCAASYVLAPEAQALADLAAWMHHRAAWVEVLTELAPRFEARRRGRRAAPSALAT